MRLFRSIALCFSGVKNFESRESEKGQQIELTFTAGTRTYTISLNKAGQVGGHIRIEEGGKAVVDKDLTRDTPAAGRPSPDKVLCKGWGATAFYRKPVTGRGQAP